MIDFYESAGKNSLDRRNTMMNLKRIKRNILFRLMTALGFGGMAAFCLSSCQSPSANSDKQPKQETVNEATAEQTPPTVEQTPPTVEQTPSTAEQTSDNEVSDESADESKPVMDEETLNTFFPPAQDNAVIVTKYGIRPPLPPQDIENIDLSVPATPEENEKRLQERNQSEEQLQK